MKKTLTPNLTKGAKLFNVSKKTEEFLTNSFTHSLPNATRRSLKYKFGAPNLPFTACPSIDKIIKTDFLHRQSRKINSLLNSKH